MIGQTQHIVGVNLLRERSVMDLADLNNLRSASDPQLSILSQLLNKMILIMAGAVVD